MQRLAPTSNWPVFQRDPLKSLERQLQARSPTPLMRAAGLSAAQLALAVAPHAQRIWVAAGPGNNGGDGLEAAMHLHLAGKTVRVSLLIDRDQQAADAQAALARALQAGLTVQTEIPQDWIAGMGPQDLCIDALLGLGASRPLSPQIQTWVDAINQSRAQVLALDLPTGLDAQSGQLLGADAQTPSRAVRAHHTLTFVAAKPGLFMGHGRDVCGDIWLESLDSDAKEPVRLQPQAWLNTPGEQGPKAHASHKGSHGDVAIIGGEPMALHGMGMSGAAVLAATAALHAGAGRVMLSLLGESAVSVPPDLMQRPWTQLDLEKLHVVCGCGGGQAIQPLLAEVLARSAQLVLDADGLNAVAQDESLAKALRGRGLQQATVITPHPLEAARLLKTDTASIQSNRLQASRDLAALFDCVVVLKGSGSVIAAPGQTPRINTTGNGKLAIGGTGDVLAGLIGARMAQSLSAFDAACAAVHQHGQVADDWPAGQSLTASQLARALY
ncbi:bifunctional ADP-dependent NAD(P)H-hydrate dehydratase/NAD(P)H-hydrate epimerase [Limnohabitans sp. MMS-10A-160]|uniref:NAD(P)H-hydrate dehydratase n=1 Tax=unclassified Limnohabitans TaxID=2626134 RepID=UPI000D38B38D|nr:MULTISPECIES: NAD(P)H-hydrate dehydratase [unclassified Limnohabitans]PUE22027.1 bifunctional ADP-dependent NAD(P)H-hydrate dehydratase/NAD(P)H-hydrate epimerase [Limnohabitans sp. MMS-10A-192]PUE25678.1 bifunctional ADP-dependent NAD(P)H-hydrate dehydratase/NAD(P)H-hydrate epimerase [Limnohabitans sp. MMS-10A-160]